MTSAKLVFLGAVMAILSATACAGLLDAIFIPTILQEKYQLAPTKEGYRLNLEEPNDTKREEVGMVINPGTPEEEFVIMGTYTVYDEKTDAETVTMYIADKKGYKSRYMLKRSKLSPRIKMLLEG